MIQIVSDKKNTKKAWMQNLQSLYLGRKGQAWNKALWLLLEGVGNMEYFGKPRAKMLYVWLI